MSQWKQGDTLPDMTIDCFDDSRNRPDLSDAQEVRVIVSRGGNTVWERVVDGDANGVVTVPLQPSDTATPGTFFVKAKVTTSEGKTQHYPPADRYLTMTVTR